MTLFGEWVEVKQDRWQVAVNPSKKGWKTKANTQHSEQRDLDHYVQQQLDEDCSKAA